jgi:hypothetical protein
VKKPLKKTTTMKNTLSIFIAIIIFTSCKKDNNNTPAAATTIPVAVDNNLGTFIGDLDVSADDKLIGKINNAKVTVISNGSIATFKVMGDYGFDREYKANVSGVYINPEKQIKPVEKTVGGVCAINGNILFFNIQIFSDVVGTSNGVASGKIQLQGSSLIKQ